ncbi:MAG: hypothetical protein WKF75_10235, partial [Singulisphaera sp.]
MRNQRHELVGMACGWVAAVGLATPVLSQEGAMQGVTAADLLGHIKVLAADEFEGRGPGTPGEEQTVAYLTEQFRKLGLKPGNPDGSVVQNVPLVGFRAQSVEGAFRAGDATIDLKFPDDWVAVSRSLAQEVKVENSEVVFVGYGVVAPEYGWDDFKGVDVRGKTVVMLVNDPAVPDPKDPACARPRRLPRQGDDLLRALDVQVRDRLGEGGGRRDPRPRDGTGGLSLFGRRRQLGAGKLRHRGTRRWRQGPGHGRGVGEPGDRQEALHRRRARFRRPQAGRPEQGFPARPPEGQGPVHDQERDPSGPVAQR